MESLSRLNWLGDKLEGSEFRLKDYSCHVTLSRIRSSGDLSGDHCFQKPFDSID